jgi:hypothetical protein
METKDLFGTGMGYTGLSRVRTKDGLFLIDLHLDKIYCNGNIPIILSQMKEIKYRPSIFQNSSQFVNILYHNIEGLKCNFRGLRNYYLTNKVDIICLSETWLNEKDNNLEELHIQGYKLFHKTRFFSFKLNHTLKSKKGGDVSIYMKENFPTREIEISQQLNLECFGVEIEKYNLIVITCYRSLQQSKNEFLSNLIEYLKEVNIQRKILLIGDFNEDTSYQGMNLIECKMESLGFKNLFKSLPTTKNITSLDCVYHYEYPLMYISGVGKYILSKLVRDNHGKVVLTGEGSDEIFSGYVVVISSFTLQIKCV